MFVASFEEGAKSCLTLAGLGKLAPNLVLVGFKETLCNNAPELNCHRNYDFR